MSLGGNLPPLSTGGAEAVLVRLTEVPLDLEVCRTILSTVVDRHRVRVCPCGWCGNGPCDCGFGGGGTSCTSCGHLTEGKETVAIIANPLGIAPEIRDILADTPEIAP